MSIIRFHWAACRRLGRMLVAAAGLSAAFSTGAQTYVPADAASSCVVSAANFSSWFVGGKVVPNGPVKPADSVAFNHDTINPPVTNKTINCNFYQWSQQMFLWLTSPSQAIYGSGSRVLDSAIFYDVLNDDTTDNLCLVNNELRLNSCGVSNGGISARFRTRVNKPRATAIVLKANPDAGAGQAGGGGALMAQGGKFVYYTMHVNDVYAFYASASGTNNPALIFPTTQADLDKVLAWAKRNHRPVPDPNALALELKASWVDATGLDTSQYITMMGVIPTFDTSSSTKWVQNGSKQVLLAMVGLHVVGSAAGHPEMIWATYEHLNNSPNAAYAYVNKAGKTVNLPPQVPNRMMFAANGAKGPFNVENMAVDAEATVLTIAANTGQTISPSNTMRIFPWGTSPLVPLMQNLTAAQGNTEVISINNNVRGMLGKGDIRKNYLLIGATWTVGGKSPFDPFSPPGPDNQFNHAGTNALANSTMETYVTLENKKYTCFSCHALPGGQTNTTATVDVSHIYSDITPFDNSFTTAPLLKARPRPK